MFGWKTRVVRRYERYLANVTPFPNLSETLAREYPDGSAYIGKVLLSLSSNSFVTSSSI
jgi:hypothetical protein